MDYEKIAAGAVHAVKTAELNRFHVICALVSDLCCPGYNPNQPLAKDRNLALTAARYKIDKTKTSAAVRAELAKTKDRTKPANKIGTTTTRQPKGSTRKSFK